MMQGAFDLAESERGVFSIAVVLAATVLVALGKITGDLWVTIVQWIAITLVASKTISGAVETIARKPQFPPSSSEAGGTH